MKSLRRFLAGTLLLAAARTGSAQVVPCTQLGEEPPPCTAPAAPPPGAVALLDGEFVTLKDLEAPVREAAEKRDTAVAEARRNAVKSEVEALLVALEAGRRKVAAKDLHYAEVEGRLVAPSDAEIAAEVEAHAEKYGKDAESAWARAKQALVTARTTKLREELVARLSRDFPVTFGADPKAAGLGTDSVLATVGGRTLTYGEMRLRLDTAAARAALSSWRRVSRAVEELVDERLARRESVKRGVTAEELKRQEITAKIAPVSDEEVSRTLKELAYWLGPDTPASRRRAADRLTSRREGEAEEAFEKKLREGHTVKLLIGDAPKLPAQVVATAGSPSRGNASAPVTLVEFGDFECGPCGYVSGVVDEALKGYEKRVRFVFRQNPLAFHPFAAKAAEAALAAHAQGKFFEYERVLFANQSALDVASLKRHAASIGLDTARFDKEVDSGRWAADVRQDLRDGERHGVVGTPWLFLAGGTVDSEAFTVEGLRAAFDKALAKKAR